MKRTVLFLLVCGLTAAWVGCESTTDTSTPPRATPAQSATTATPTTDDTGDTADVTEIDDSEYVLVNLSVPGMT